MKEQDRAAIISPAEISGKGYGLSAGRGIRCYEQCESDLAKYEVERRTDAPTIPATMDVRPRRASRESRHITCRVDVEVEDQGEMLTRRGGVQ